MKNSYLRVEHSPRLKGQVSVFGAKNAVLVIMASLILTRGTSILTNVPASADIFCMIALLQELGADVHFSTAKHCLTVDTSNLSSWCVSAIIMKKMRASILVLGPLLARFGFAKVALPGGCAIGGRPIDFHLKNFIKMGVEVTELDACVNARVVQSLQGRRLVLEYPSVGATENLLLAAVVAHGVTHIVNAAFEPEVFDLINVLRLMGAHIVIDQHTLVIHGVAIEDLKPITYDIMPDRLEAGSILLAAAVTGGEVFVPQVPANTLDLFLVKLQEMGHEIIVQQGGFGITIHATDVPQAVSFKTGPYPSFPTDLQAPMMVAQCLASGISVIEETVWENRLLHVDALRCMGANIVLEHNRATVRGVKGLRGTLVEATDIRASCALVIAGLAASGITIVRGAHHWERGYEKLEERLGAVGASIIFCHE